MVQGKTAVTIAVATLALASLAVSGPAFAQPPAPPMAGHMGGEHKPLIHKALRQLTEALKTLTAAKHDEEGHREKAQQLVQQAIAECQTCLQEK